MPLLFDCTQAPIDQLWLGQPDLHPTSMLDLAPPNPPLGHYPRLSPPNLRKHHRDGLLYVYIHVHGGVVYILMMSEMTHLSPLFGMERSSNALSESIKRSTTSTLPRSLDTITISIYRYRLLSPFSLFNFFRFIGIQRWKNAIELEREKKNGAPNG